MKVTFGGGWISPEVAKHLQKAVFGGGWISPEVAKHLQINTPRPEQQPSPTRNKPVSPEYKAILL